MLGHKNGLDGVYLTPTKNELFDEFQKAITDLSIDNTATLLSQNQKLEKEKNESVANRELIDDLQTQLVQLQFELKAVTTSVQTKYDDELQQRKEKLGIA